MGKYTITPWRYHSDLLRVRHDLYSTGGESSSTSSNRTAARQQAVHRIMAWKQRGNLPHAVESTALLTDAQLHHDIPGTTVFSVRAVYAAAFTRFVTGFCDIGRNRERALEPSSMLDIARQLGMPVEFVALRHEATHEELPAVARLVRATERALRWLWDVYWSRLEEPEMEVAAAAEAELPRVRIEAGEILRTYRSARRVGLKTKKKQKIEEVRETCNACVGLMQSNALKAEALAGVWVEEKLFMPSNRR
jgi:ribosomal biogenesis protein LAS1